MPALAYAPLNLSAALAVVIEVPLLGEIGALRIALFALGVLLAFTPRLQGLPYAFVLALPIEQGGYQALAPSTLAVRDHWPVPKALDVSDIKTIIDQFVRSAERAMRADLDVIELHGAHGDLIHSLSVAIHQPA